MTNGTSSDQNSEVQSLRAPLDAAQTLSDNWDRYDLGNADWSNPPSNLPPDVANAIQLVEKNPALLKAINGGNGPVTKDELDSFIGNAQDNLDKAVKDYEAWQKANPNAGPMATALAQSAAVLEANDTLLGGQYSAADLKNLGMQNPGLSSRLTGAAAMWSQPGMLFQLDNAGQSLGTTADGLVNAGNVSAWLKGGAPSSDDAAIDMINAATARGPTAGIDTSNLNSDIFAHPENYTAEQKAAALQQLVDTQTRLDFDSSPDVQLADAETEEADGINPNLDKTKADLQNKINTLANDPDVQKFLNDNTAQYFQGIVNADPDLKAAIKAADQKFQTGRTLNDDLAAKDNQGNQVSQAVAVQSFVAQAGFFQLANGGSPLDLTAIAKNSGSYQKILDYYDSNVVTSSDLSTMLATGDSSDTAIANFGREVQAYGAVIDPSDGAPRAAALQDNLNNTVLSMLTPAQLEAALGDGHGNLDTTKLHDLTAGLGSLSPADQAGIVAAIQALWNAVVFGTQTTEAAKDVGLISWSNPLTKQYDVGTLHGVSAILGGIALGLSLEGGLPSDPAGIAAAVGTGILNFGTLINSAGRVFNAANSPSATPEGSKEPSGGGIESHPGKRPPISTRGPAIGETTSGIGGIIGGAAGIVVGLHQKAAGDVELGNISIANSAITLGAGVADTVEGGLNALGLGGIEIAGSELGDWAGLVDGLIDTPIALAAFGLGVASVAISLREEGEADVNETKSVDAELNQYGITGGPITPRDIQGTTSLGQGSLPVPPNSNAPGNAPPVGPSQTHPG